MDRLLLLLYVLLVLLVVKGLGRRVDVVGHVAVVGRGRAAPSEGRVLHGGALLPHSRPHRRRRSDVDNLLRMAVLRL